LIRGKENNAGIKSSRALYPEAEAGAKAGGERLPLWSAALMRRDFLLSRVNADGKQTGETNTEGETPMRFFSSP
jgi:hypothetical protein